MGKLNQLLNSFVGGHFVQVSENHYRLSDKEDERHILEEVGEDYVIFRFQFSNKNVSDFVTCVSLHKLTFSIPYVSTVEKK